MFQRQPDQVTGQISVKLPTFNENYFHWSRFRELYVQPVHLLIVSNAQKMFDLTTNLAGEPKHIIKHTSVLEENYDTA